MVMTAGTMAALAGMYFVIAVIGLAVAILQIIANWKIFKKAGEPGWKSIIPIYNDYTRFKLFWKPVWFWITLVLSFVLSFYSASLSTLLETTSFTTQELLQAALLPTLMIIPVISFLTVLEIVHSVLLAKCFGKSGSFAVGLVCLPTIFTLILAFGSAQYVGNPDRKITE